MCSSDLGIAVATALLSLLVGHSVDKRVAMTGEMTLRGRVLPVGGIKEKVLAAHRVGIKKVVLPRQNERDLDDIPATIRRQIQFVLVEEVAEVFAACIGGDALRRAA
mgnify:CR=1 FL=1